MLSKSLKQSTGKGFELTKLKNRTKKDRSQSIEIRARNIKEHTRSVVLYPKYFGNSKNIKIKDKLPKLAILVDYNTNLIDFI